MFKDNKMFINLILKYTLLNIFILIFFSFFSNVSGSELDNFFLKLKNASDRNIAKQYESKIWKYWLTDGSNETSNFQMQTGASLLQSNELQDALKIFESLSKKEPQWAEPINKIATIKFLMGDYKGSVNDIKLTLLLEPRHFGAISGLIQIYIFEKKYEKALENLEFVIEIHPYIGIKNLKQYLKKLVKKTFI